ncbi:MAG: hypothetical protein AAB787_03440 [Patescibacteria group bacterium]
MHSIGTGLKKLTNLKRFLDDGRDQILTASATQVCTGFNHLPTDGRITRSGDNLAVELRADFFDESQPVFSGTEITVDNDNLNIRMFNKEFPRLSQIVGRETTNFKVEVSQIVNPIDAERLMILDKQDFHDLFSLH